MHVVTQSRPAPPTPSIQLLSSVRSAVVVILLLPSIPPPLSFRFHQGRSRAAMISTIGGGGGEDGGSSSSSRIPPTEPKSRPRQHPPAPPPHSKWRSGTQHRIYGRRLLDALRATDSAQPRAVKAAADSALALTARGQTRWSRAILLSSCRRRVLLKAAAARIRRPKAHPPSPSQLGMMTGRGSDDKKVKERLRVLGRLVPGCRQLPAPALLEEATDYVAALEMQVKTMRALADALAAVQLSSPSDSPAETER